MKVLMRADTHVTFTIPESEPKAKCTCSQVWFKCELVQEIISTISCFSSR